MSCNCGQSSSSNNGASQVNFGQELKNIASGKEKITVWEAISLLGTVVTIFVFLRQK